MLLTYVGSFKAARKCVYLVASIVIASVPVAIPAMAQDFWNAQPLTPEEEAAMLDAIGKAQASGEASSIANGFAGLDPTGVTRMVLDAQTQTHAAEVQKYLPGMMATNLQRARDYCSSTPQADICDDLAKLEAQLGQSYQ